MWKSLILDLLAPLHNRIFLVSMWSYEANSALSTIKTTGLYHVPIKGYSKNGHPFFILKRVLTTYINADMKITTIQWSKFLLSNRLLVLSLQEIAMKRCKSQIVITNHKNMYKMYYLQ